MYHEILLPTEILIGEMGWAINDVTEDVVIINGECGMTI